MTTEHDPSIWQSIANWLWIALGAPIAFVWKKATEAVTRADLHAHLEEDRVVHVEIKEMIQTLSNNAHTDRKELHETVLAIREDMHKIHLDILEKLK